MATGVVFFAEGIQKFLYADALGSGRFAKIGIPAPEVMGPFVGAVETVGGALLLLGFLTRLAAVPLIIDMLVALASTKIPILIGHAYLIFAKPPGSKFGSGACCTRLERTCRCSCAWCSCCSLAAASIRSTE